MYGFGEVERIKSKRVAFSSFEVHASEAKIPFLRLSAFLLFLEKNQREKARPIGAEKARPIEASKMKGFKALFLSLVATVRAAEYGAYLDSKKKRQKKMHTVISHQI